MRWSLPRHMSSQIIGNIICMCKYKLHVILYHFLSSLSLFSLSLSLSLLPLFLYTFFSFYLFPPYQFLPSIFLFPFRFFDHQKKKGQRPMYPPIRRWFIYYAQFAFGWGFHPFQYVADPWLGMAIPPPPPTLSPFPLFSSFTLFSPLFNLLSLSPLLRQPKSGERPIQPPPGSAIYIFLAVQPSILFLIFNPHFYSLLSWNLAITEHITCIWSLLPR